MKKYSIFHIPFMAFYSKALYRDIALSWKGVCFGYLILMLALCWIPTMLKFNSVFSFMLDSYARQFVDQIPEVRIINGKASIDAPVPYYIIDPTSHRALVIFDTTGRYTVPEDAGAFALVTEIELIVKKSDHETTRYSFRDIEHFILTRQMIRDFTEMLRKYLALALYPLALLGSFVFRIIQVLIYAAIGLVFASVCKSNRSYDSLIRLSVAAITPGLIIDTILYALDIHLPFAGLWFFLAAMGYLYYGVRAAKEEKAQPDNMTSPHS